MEPVILTDAGLAYAQSKLAKWATHVTIHVTTEQWDVYTSGREGRYEDKAFPPGTASSILWRPTGRVENRHTVTVTGDAPVIPGYKLAGRVDHLPEGNIVCEAPGETLPASFRTAPAVCDHCFTIRARHSTFVLRSAADDTYVSIGRNCLAEYIRSPEAAQAILEWAAMTQGVTAALGEAASRSGGEPLYDCVTLTRAAILVSDHFGWVSGAMARDDHRLTPTWGRVLDVLNAPIQHEDEAYKTLRTLLAEGRRQTEADAVAAWVAAVDQRPDAEVDTYLSNLCVAFRQGAVARKHVGLVASAFRAHRREEADRAAAIRTAAQKDAPPTGNYVGTIGTRFRNLPVKVTFIKSLGVQPGYNGGPESERFICKFETLTGGDTVVWFTGENLAYNEGDVLGIDATPTKQEPYGTPPRLTTTVSRVATSKPVVAKKPRAKKAAK